MLRTSSFGWEPHSLLRILNTIVLPTINYASFIYSSACKTEIEKLNSIQNTTICLSLGAFKTSPANSLHVLSSSLPLDLRRLQFCLRYTLKIYTMNSHPLYHKFQDQESINRLSKKSQRYQPFYVRAHNELEEVIDYFPIDTKNIQYISDHFPAPWSFKEILIDLSFACCKKEDMNPLTIKTMFLEKINTIYSDYDYIYTDESNKNEKSGFGVF